VIGVAAGAALGLVAAGGVLLFSGAMQTRRGPRLADRLAPHLPSAAPVGLRLPIAVAAPRSGWRTLAGRAVPWLDAVSAAAGGGRGVDVSADRLAAAGRTGGPNAYRTEQVGFAAVGAAFGVVLVVLLAAGGSGSWFGLLPAAGTGAIAGLLACDRRLALDTRRRRDRVLAELPVVADLLALAVAAGEGPVGAVERVTRLTRGSVLGGELTRAMAEVRTGVPFPIAMDGVAARCRSSVVQRFTDGLVVAVERGTPLAEVLRAQADDVRADRRSALMEAAGRAEVLMLLPVVFLILPVTVVVALYPGVVGLSLSTP
jgi:tight adherence protein C